MNLKAELERRITAALAACGAPAGSPAIVASSVRAELGDYQANGIMPAAKAMGVKPRDLAEKVVRELARGGAGDLSDLAETPTIAGPGFINIRLKADWLARQLAATRADDHLGAERAGEKNRQTVVVDYSGPNLAREMHVGHLRSTIIGDALARTLDFLGHDVKRQNHVGDWGTQCGMLVAYLRRMGVTLDVLANTAAVLLSDLEEYYRRANECSDNDPEFRDEARMALVELQTGVSEETTEWWKAWRHVSLVHCLAVYDRLGIRQLAENGVVRGESAYNADLPNVVEDLRKAGLLKESRGAQCVFLPEFKDKEGNELPLIVQKTDEGFLYATTDLAAIRYRVRELKADRILYVTDSRQSLHFRQVFAVARAAKFAPPSVALEHVAFGMMLGADGKPFRTREGGTVKLMGLLDEAEKRALKLVNAKNPDLDKISPATRSPTSSASARSSTPTSPRTAPATTCSVGTRCSRWTATRPRTCSTPTPASAASSVKVLPTVKPRPAPSTLSNRRSGRWHWCWCNSPRPSWPWRGSACRTSCVPTCTTWPGRLWDSTRPARSSRPTAPRGRAAWPCAI